MGIDKGLEHVVHNDGTVERDHPHEKTEAEDAPVWDEPEDESEEGLKDFEAANNHPVS